MIIEEKPIYKSYKKDKITRNTPGNMCSRFIHQKPLVFY